MEAEVFDRFVDEALDALPQDFRQQLRNVEIVVEDWPDQETLRLARLRHPARLLGFYHGIPLTERGQGYHAVLPDKISLYRNPIVLRCKTDDEVRALVHHVLRHEVAHYFGISDRRLRELGAY
ncbi:MAG: metallopeptidase family protein [Chloroflexi bacterium]|nr:metallopeptidase family protein [Chloroflexota bacterium]